MALSSKVKASSVLEVVIAFLLLSIIMVLSFSIFTNVMKGGYNYRKVAAWNKIKELSLQMNVEKNYLSEEFEEEDYTIKKEADYYKGESGNLIQVKWQAVDPEGNVLTELREVVLKE